MSFLEYLKSRLSWKTAFLVLLWLSAGTLLLVCSYYQRTTHSFASFLEQQFGGLCIFSAAIPVLSDFLLKRDFEALIQQTVDRVELERSIKTFGLAAIVRDFDEPALWARIEESSAVTMLVLRSGHFFERHHERLCARLQRAELSLRVLLPNPDKAAIMELMGAKFSDLETCARMSANLRETIRTWLQKRIHDNLSGTARARLQVSLIDKYPLYSAYIFDHKEFWYIPYHFRDNHQPIPTFIFRGDFSSNEIFRNLQDLGENSRPIDWTAM